MLLACDPGFRNYGCAVIDQYGQIIDVGTIQTKKTTKKLLRTADDDVQRITYITEKLSSVIHHYNIKGILAELPPSGGQSAAAVKGLSMAVALSTALFTELGIPVEWATPEEVKRALTGAKNASKEDMMKSACCLHDWKIMYKKVYTKSTKKLLRTDSIFHLLGKTMGKSQFEHIADACGAFEALKHSNTARIYLQKSAA